MAVQKTLPNNFTYEDLEDAYIEAGPNSGSYIIVNPEMYTAIKAKFTSIQRYTTGNASGFGGLVYNSAVIVNSRYAPGQTLTFSDSPDYDDFDEFTEWVKDVREQAAKKKTAKKAVRTAENAETRKFLDKRYGKRRNSMVYKAKSR
jgi:RNA recognition motif-containing protein